MRLLPLLSVLAFLSQLAAAEVTLGTGNSSLLGGDLTDPTNAIQERPGVDYAQGLPEDALRPLNTGWLGMTMAPVSPPGAAPTQMHPYQSWQGSPACAIFLNKPEHRKWYVSFKDGGKGGPTKSAPYYCAVQLKEPAALTHFTLTTSPDMPDRDPMSWAIQASNTGRDNDWTSVFTCAAKTREGSPLRAATRTETTLFTSFTSANLASSVSPADLPSLQAKLSGKQIDKADFSPPTRAYTWFRIAIYSCFNRNTKKYADFNRPPGFALGQLELFGYTAATKPGKAAPAATPAKAPPAGGTGK
ncbi:MAG: hypothetical protein NTW21_40260 [Verrucomicrobia bacterium]|nr:hypothetical protein [Verrucomicrobiota bacterium]